MWLFLTSPLGRKVGLAVVGLALLYGCYRWSYNRGNAAGYGEGQRTQLELDKQSFQQDRKVFLDTLSAAQKVADEAQKIIEDKNSQLAQLKSKRDAVKKDVAALPASSLIPDIRGRIGLPSEGVLDEATLRRIDDALAVGAVVQQEVEALTGKSEAQDKRISAIEAQRDAAILYGNQVTGYYVKAYAAAQKKPNWFMRLFHIKGKHLDLPDPITLKGETK